MIQASKETLQTALTNNSFDLDMTEKIIRMAQDNSYNYLYRLQRNIVIYEEHFYTTTNNKDIPDYGDLYLDHKERVCINFPVDLIGTGNREKFRTSKYSKAEINISSFSEDTSIFYKLPIITIDNHVLKSFSVKLFDDHFVAILPYGKNFLFEKEYDEKKKHYIYIEHNIQLQVVNNVKIYDLEINKGMLQLQSPEEKYDTLLHSYVMKSSGIDLHQKTEGMYFAVVFTNDDKYLGSQLHAVDIHDDHIHMDIDKDTSDIIGKSNGNITIRFIYFKYCHMHIPYNGEYVKTRITDTGVKPEMFLIQKKELKQYDMPVPRENLFIQKFNVNEMVDGVAKSKELYSNENIKVTYPNIYRTLKNNEGDAYKVFYFYQEGYDLKYMYKYQFFLKYLYFKWGKKKSMGTEELLNAIYFKDILYDDENSEDKLVIDWNDLITYTLSGQGILLLNNDGFDKHNEHYDVSLKDVDVEDDITSPTNYSAYFKNVNIENEEPTPLALAQFENMFNFIIDNDAYDYVYDDIDYMKNYSHKMSSFDYKTTKLKRFISDDFGILHKYVLNQNKVSIKFGFNVNEVEMASRYRTKPDNPSSKLVFNEPMYLFTFDNTNPKGFLISRIFIDGLLCTDIYYDSYQFSNYVYIPVRKFENAHYTEIEIYPSYNDSRTINFDYYQEYIDLEYEPDEQIIPTITDLYFELPDHTPIDRDSFSFQLVYDEFTYSEAEKAYGYRTADRSGYYIKGDHGVYKYFNEFCIRDSNKDITKDDFDTKLVSGEIINETIEMSLWNNELDIIDDTDYVEFIDVCDGKSIINPFNVGVYATKLTRPKEFNKSYTIYMTKDGSGYYSENGIYHKSNGELDPEKNISKIKLEQLIFSRDVIKSTKSNTVKVRIRLKDDKYYNTDILVKIDKESIFKYQIQDADNYPCIEVPLDNYNCTDEYLRIFREGRKISKNQYALIERRGKHYLQYFQRIDIGKEVAVDLTPYRNRLVYYTEELSPDENGEIIVDLKGYINKPFDIKYYDVYLNGRRLTKHNIFPFSPYQFKLSDVHSIYHFEVYEKDRDWEYYGCDFDDYLTVSDLISKSFIEKSVADEVIDDITGPREPNDNTEKKEIYDRQLDTETIFFEIFYFNELLPLVMTNPDIVQCEDAAVQEFYKIVWDMYNTKNDLGETVLFLNPDIMHEGEKTEEGDYKDRFYTLWNDDNYMDTH